MIQKILIANRGEIACRVIKTCKLLGIRSVAVYSDVDKTAQHVLLADEAVCIGGSSPQTSYLKMDALIAAAKSIGADAIHPGYGFLSENAVFAELCLAEGLIFIGPHPGAIRAMGSKKEAKDLVAKHGVPTIPGYNGNNQDPDFLMQEAKKIGYPLLIKAAAGGGGKGMRIVQQESEFMDALTTAKREAFAAFHDDTVLLEKYFPKSRHIEVQIFGDKHGNIIHFFERECSIQRRYQKIIEEAPSPALNPDQRNAITHAAVKAAKAIQYDNAGTVEFLLDDNGNFYFLEINTRIQVEHPVTEMITGMDLIALQIAVAEGQQLPEQPSHFSGHAIECRLYAEDPYEDFLPRTGQLTHFFIPHDGIRIDTGVTQGDTISVFYDPMIAKIIAKGNHRNDAIRKLTYALQNSVVQGLITNQTFLLQILKHPAFIHAELSTHFIKEHWESLQPQMEEHLLGIAAIVYHSLQTPKPFPFLPRGWRNNPFQKSFELLSMNNHTQKWEYQWHNDHQLTVYLPDTQQQWFIEHFICEHQTLTLFINGVKYVFAVSLQNDQIEVTYQGVHKRLLIEDKFPDVLSNDAQNAYLSQMPGEVVKVLVNPGETIVEGAPLIIINSMKMENTIYANQAGIVKEIYVQAGNFVEAKTQLLCVEPMVEN